MRALEPYIAPLTFDVPPPTPQRNVLDQIAAKQIQRRLNRKEEDGYGSDYSSRSGSSISIENTGHSSVEGLKGRDRRKAEKADRQRVEKIGKKERNAAERKLKEDGKRHKRGSRECEKKTEKERKKIAQMEYIVVENLNEIN